MEVIYSAQRDGFEAGKVYRNPRYFDAPMGNETKVIVCGDWPDVASAYRDAGVEVEIRPGPVKAGQVPPIPEGLKAQVETGAPVYDPRRDMTREDVQSAIRDGSRAAIELSTRVGKRTTEQPVAIPADWNEMHWKSRQKLAEEIDPDFVPDPANRVPSIDAFIKAEVAKRSAGGDQ
jgi:hypothetical protein